MKHFEKIWVVEYNDDCDGWEPMGHFSTEEKAKEYMEVLLKEDSYITTDRDDYRIDWHYIDKGYFD